MIFATVGTQLPFDRLLSSLDRWAGVHRSIFVKAQTGQSGGGFRNLSCAPFLSANDFQSEAERARIIVGHAGMGTILTAAELGKPVVIMPRRADLGEHRNDHQTATAEEMRSLHNVHVVNDTAGLAQTLDTLLKAEANGSGARLSPYASPTLIRAVSAFVQDGL